MQFAAQTLDDELIIDQYDKSKILESAYYFPDQCRQAWEESYETVIPASSLLVKNILFSGMGGSALPGRIIDSLGNSILRVPFEISTSYHLPSYCGLDTLVILVSYSGDTEETLSSLAHAREKGCKVFIITSGGELKKIGQQFDFPGYYFAAKYNSSGQPRTGTGYPLFGSIGLLSKSGLLKFTNEQANSAIHHLRAFGGIFSPRIPTFQNPAKLLASSLTGKIPVIVSADHLLGSAHHFQNSLHETAKTFAALFDIPELNHHLLEGLEFPQSNQERLVFLFLESDLFHPEIKKRIKITKEVIKKNGIDYLHYQANSKQPFTECLEIVQLSEFVSFYLATLNHVNPAPVPWVDYFKNRMKNLKY